MSNRGAAKAPEKKDAVSLAELKAASFEVQPVEEASLLSHYSCSICQALAWIPVYTPCDHTYCKSCIEKWLETKSTCPTCRSDLKTTQLKSLAEQKIAMRTLGSVKIYCPRYRRYGCDWKGDYSGAESHLQSCLWMVVKCTNATCGMEMRREMLRDHVAECKYRQTECKNCQESMKFIELEPHLEVCPQVWLQCKKIISEEKLGLGGCDIKVKRMDLADHRKNICPKTEIKCSYKCGVSFRRDQQQEHQKQYADMHLGYFAAKLDKTEKQLKKMAFQGKCIIVVGGDVCNAEGKYAGIKDVYCFWLESCQWTKMMDAPFPGSRAGLCSINHLIYLVDGYDDDKLGTINSVYQFNGSKQWKKCADSLAPRQGCRLVRSGNCLYKIGGCDGEVKDDCHCCCYDPISDTWNAIAPMKYARSFFASVIYQSEIYVFGGDNIKSVESYNTMSDKWSSCDDLPIALVSSTAVVIHHKIYIFGGLPEQPEVPLCFDPRTKKWVENELKIPQMPENCSTRGVFYFEPFLIGLGVSKVYLYDTLEGDVKWIPIADMPVKDLQDPGTCVWTP